MSAGRIGSWQSAEYVGRWAGEDVVARLLETPRRISISLLEDARVDVRHVVDLGSGEGPYLADLLRAFAGARGTRRQSLHPHREDEPLQPVIDHLRRLEQAGFAAVDVPWRMLYTALLAARA